MLLAEFLVSTLEALDGVSVLLFLVFKYADDLLHIWHVELLVQSVESATAQGPELSFSLSCQVRALFHSLLFLVDCFSYFLLPVFL